MRSHTKVRINRADLIKRIETRKVEDRKRYQEAVEAFKASNEAAAEKLASFLEDQAAKVRAGRKSKVHHRYGECRIEGAPSLPGPPEKPSSYQRELRLLRMGTDDTMLLALDDYTFGKFLG